MSASDPTERLRRLAQASVEMTGASSIDGVLEAATIGARRITDAKQAVTSLTVDGNWGQSVSSVSLAEEYAAWRTYEAAIDGGGIYALVCRENRPYRLTQAELAAHPAWRGFGAAAQDHPPLRGWLAVPLSGRDGTNLGLIQVSDRGDGGDFDEYDEVALVQLATLAAAEVERLRQLELARAAAEELQRQHDLMLTITENATSALFLMDERGHPTHQNAAARAMFGFELDEIVGAPLHEAIHHCRPDGSHYPIGDCPIDRALPEQRWVEPYEDVFVRKDGSFVPVAAAASPILRDGVPIGTVVEVADISGERKLLAERDFQRSLLEAQGEVSVDGLVVVSTDRRIAWHNTRFRQIWGLSREVLAQGDDEALRHASTRVEDPGAFLGRVREIYQRRLVAHDELRLQGGATIERYGAPLESSDGTLYGYFWSFRDISERKRTEDRLAELYARERALSHRLQTGLLTSAVPVVAGHVVTSAYRPGTAALHVGGDWFDSFTLPNGRVGLIVGDVVGHDVDAAAAMGQLRGALRALARTSGPRGVLEGMDAMLRDVGTARMTTLVYVELDPSTGELRYSVAGHPPPLVVASDGTTRFLWDARSTPLGSGVPPRYTEGSATLAPGDAVVLYTDGLIERRQECLDVGMSRLARTARLLVDDGDTLADDICDDLLGRDEHDDDVCVLVCHRPRVGAFFSLLRADRGALAAIRRDLGAWLAQQDVALDVRSDVVLAVNEAVANSIEHGHRRDPGGRVAVRAAVNDDVLTITVIDDGAWRPPAPQFHRGRGLAMMRNLMEHVEVNGDDHGTTATMTRSLLDAPAPPTTAPPAT